MKPKGVSKKFYFQSDPRWLDPSNWDDRGQHQASSSNQTPQHVPHHGDDGAHGVDNSVVVMPNDDVAEDPPLPQPLNDGNRRDISESSSELSNGPSGKSIFDIPWDYTNDGTFGVVYTNWRNGTFEKGYQYIDGRLLYEGRFCVPSALCRQVVNTMGAGEPRRQSCTGS